MSLEKPKTPSPEEMHNKMELEVNLIKYAIQTRGISEIDWITKYSGFFREIFENTDVWDRYKKSYDNNPDEIYEWIQVSVEKMAEERK